LNHQPSTATHLTVAAVPIPAGDCAGRNRPGPPGHTKAPACAPARNSSIRPRIVLTGRRYRPLASGPRGPADTPKPWPDRCYYRRPHLHSRHGQLGPVAEPVIPGPVDPGVAAIESISVVTWARSSVFTSKSNRGPRSSCHRFTPTTPSRRASRIRIVDGRHADSALNHRQST
jgi:hypothetical protein